LGSGNYGYNIKYNSKEEAMTIAEEMAKTKKNLFL
jgi:hypothetical protein